jgi:hypothetical protein
MQCNARCSCQKRQSGRQQAQRGTSHLVIWVFAGAQRVGPIVTGSSWRDAASLFFSIAFAFCRDSALFPACHDAASAEYEKCVCVRL